MVEGRGTDLAEGEAGVRSAGGEMGGRGNEKLKEPLIVNGCSRLREKSCINGCEGERTSRRPLDEVLSVGDGGESNATKRSRRICSYDGVRSPKRSRIKDRLLKGNSRVASSRNF